jgi:hypothetical protein
MQAMAVEPEFFTRRRSFTLVDDPALGLAAEALLAAAEAALTRPAPTEAGLRRALRRLRDIEAAAPQEALDGLVLPVDLDEMRLCLTRPCAAWLPLASELGVADERLLTLGYPSVACRDVQLRYG